ncbi:hypothetical protein ABZV34_24935 [Streptomyces sp. NPDC005195]|uniref:hypothetical protein n=1 Tax=Streptomyces sp. NPDC005195 TaxID=3154561 RepID=UPI0033AF980F
MLTDPDQTMAPSAVLRHLGRRAAGLYPGFDYEEWAQSMAQTTIERPYLTSAIASIVAKT